MSDLGSKIRTIGLVVMIVGAIVADVILFICGQWVWGAFWCCIILLVGVFEIVCYVIQKKTISTVWKE